MDPAVTQELAEAAAAFVEAPKRLHAVILKAAETGEKPADITRAIGYVYTPDYVARLVRKARANGLIGPKAAAAKA